MMRHSWLLVLAFVIGSFQYSQPAKAYTVSTFCKYGTTTYLGRPIVPFFTLSCSYVFGPGGYAGATFASMNTDLSLLSGGAPIAQYHSGFASIAGTGEYAHYIRCFSPSNLFYLHGIGRAYIFSCSPLQGCYYQPVPNASEDQTSAFLSPPVPCA